MSGAALPCIPINVGTDLGATFGALLAGTFLSLVLYGAGLVQTFIYFAGSNHNDSWILKGTIIAAVLFDTVHEFLATIGMWGYLVTNFGNLVNLGALHPPFVLQILFSQLCGAAVQSFFVWRIFVFSGKKWIFPALLGPVIPVSVVLTAYYVHQALAANTVAGLASLAKVSEAINSLTVAIDVIIAITLFTLLALGRTRFNKRTDRMIVRLMTISVNTGSWTALAALITIILVKIQPQNLYYAISNTALASLYVNTLLANLNSRDFVTAPKKQVSTIGNSSTGNTAMCYGNTGTGGRQTFNISVDNATMFETDYHGMGSMQKV